MQHSWCPSVFNKPAWWCCGKLDISWQNRASWLTLGRWRPNILADRDCDSIQSRKQIWAFFFYQNTFISFHFFLPKCDKYKRFISLKWGLWKWSWPNFNDASAPPFSLLLSSLTHSLSLSRSPLSSSCLTSSLADWITTVMHVPNYLHPTPPHSSTTQASNPLHTSSLHTRCTLVQCVQIAGICVHALRSWMRVLVTEQIKQRNVFSPAGLIRFHPCLF